MEAADQPLSPQAVKHLGVERGRGMPLESGEDRAEADIEYGVHDC
jgi:hypothetical protein